MRASQRRRRWRFTTLRKRVPRLDEGGGVDIESMSAAELRQLILRAGAASGECESSDGESSDGESSDGAPAPPLAPAADRIPGGLWPARGQPPPRCEPASVAACGSRVLLRTADYVVFDKPPDVRMDGEHHAVTMNTLAASWLGAAAPRFCHRLDYGTSGLLLGAFSKATAAAACGAFEAKTARKTYAGVVAGWVAGATREIAAPLEPVGGGDFRVRVGAGPRSKPAATR